LHLSKTATPATLLIDAAAARLWLLSGFRLCFLLLCRLNGFTLSPLLEHGSEIMANFKFKEIEGIGPAEGTGYCRFDPHRFQR
jgi:hypothetical protein